MVKQLIAVTVVALCVGVGVTAAQSTTQATPQIADSFIWHGEFVAYDAAARTLTVKAQVLTEIEKDVSRFKAGERVLLTWSGLDTRAAAIRAVAAYSAGSKITVPFALPAELTAAGVQGGLITVRFRVPDAKVDGVKAVKPGEWVTLTARQLPASETAGLTLVEPYVKALSGTK